MRGRGVMNVKHTFFGNSLLVATVAAGAVLGTACSSSGSDDGVGAASGVTDGRSVELETPLDPTKAYRLVALWAQIDDDGPDPAPSLAFDVPFDPGTSSLKLPEASEPTEPNLWCVRADEDETTSPCEATSPYAVGLALIFIAEDTDGDGKFTWDPAKGWRDNGELENVALFVRGSLIFSQKGGDALPSRSDGTPQIIDGDISPGVNFYEAYEPEPTGDGANFDRLRRASPNAPLVFTKGGVNLS